MSEPPDDETAARGTAPWRWLLVIVPVVILLATTAKLISGWSLHWPDTPPEAPAPIAQREAPAIEDVFARLPKMPPSAPAPSEPADAFDAANVIALLTSADLESGAKYMRMCMICHSAEKDAAHRVGPNLWNVVGRPVADDPDFRYSQALRNKGGAWSYEELAAFLNNPRVHTPGTSMAFRGIAEEQKLANVIAYLRTLADSPIALPE